MYTTNNNLFRTNENKRSRFGQFVESNLYEDASSVSRSTIDIRLGFLKKVYGLLTVQLSVTILISTLIMSVPAIARGIVLNSFLLPMIGLGTIGCLFALESNKKEYPTNFILLGVFTLLESVCIGTVVSLYETHLVVQALLLTLTIVTGLTVYTLVSKKDFNWLGATLCSAIWLLLIGSIIQMFVRSPTLHIVGAVFGAFLFSLFIIYDTHLIMKKLSPEEYISAVVRLYMDIINLFMEILKILRHLQQTNDANGQQRQQEKKKSK